MEEMTELPDLKQLTSEVKDALIESLSEENQKLRKATEKRPKKTSKNSSLPPSQGFRPSALAKPKPAKLAVKPRGSLGREGGGRPFGEQPDEIVKAPLQQCGACGMARSTDIQKLIQRYDKIEIPPIRPLVRQVERYGCKCPSCGSAQLAALPEQLTPGSPFGDSIATFVTTLGYSHTMSYGRMGPVMQEVFGLENSEGAIANLLLRVKQQLKMTVNGIVT